jgi:hypothetical protein
MYRMLTMFWEFSFKSQETVSFSRSNYLHFYVSAHACIVVVVSSVVWERGSLNCFTCWVFNIFMLSVNTLYDRREGFCVCVLEQEGYIIHIIVYIVKTRKGCSYNEVYRTKVILFAKSIGTFLGLNIWWICVLHKYE